MPCKSSLPKLAIICLVFLSPFLSGCTTLVGAGATVGIAAAQERGIKGRAEDLKIEALASNNLLIERFQYGKTDFFRTAWVADYPDPENFLKLFYI